MLCRAPLQLPSERPLQQRTLRPVEQPGLLVRHTQHLLTICRIIRTQLRSSHWTSNQRHCQKRRDLARAQGHSLYCKRLPENSEREGVLSMSEKVYRTELTPLSFLRRSAYMFPDKIAVVHGE